MSDVTVSCVSHSYAEVPLRNVIFYISSYIINEGKHTNLTFDEIHPFETTERNNKLVSEHNMKVRKLCLSMSSAHLNVIYSPSISNEAQNLKSRHKLEKVITRLYLCMCIEIHM